MEERKWKKTWVKPHLMKIFSVSDLSCLFSWAARNSSWIFLVICSVLRMTSSVLGSVGSDSTSESSSSGIELPSPSQPLLLSLPLLYKLQRKIQKIQVSCHNPCLLFLLRRPKGTSCHLKILYKLKLRTFPQFLQLVQTIILGDALTLNHPSPSHSTCCHSHFLACCFASLTLRPTNTRECKYVSDTRKKKTGRGVVRSTTQM